MGFLINPYRFEVVFSPSSISNLYAWYDASDITTITKTSDRVSQWNNKEGTTARDLVQATGGSQPLWLSANKNGKDVIDFTSSRKMATSAVLTSIPQPITSFLVVYVPATDASVHHSITEFDESSGSTFHIFYKEDNDTLRTSSGSADSFTDATLLNSWRYVTVISNNATASKIRVGGVEKLSSVITGTNGFAGIRVGEYRTTGRYWNNKIAEIIIYSKLLDATEIGNVESYLATRWGF